MLEDLFKVFTDYKDLVSKAFDNVTKMLELIKNMYDIAYQGYENNVIACEVQEKVREMDIRINKLHRKTRKMLLEHLLLSKGEDIIEGMKISTVLDNLERLGDYVKNLTEISCLRKTRPIFGSKNAEFKEKYMLVGKMFDDLLDIYNNDKLSEAKVFIKKASAFQTDCDDKIACLFEIEDKLVNKDIMAYVLFLRFIKRVVGHMLNVATSVSNPYHAIGYNPDDI
ncbi:MAG: PhoU domain-containing protein [Pseudomonadota bacterium]